MVEDSSMIFLKNSDEIEKMYRASQIVAQALLKLKESVSPGITTEDLDRIAEEFIRSEGATPTFIGYQDYPKTLCTSVNDEVVHGIPSVDKKLKDGDVIGIDCGATWDGFVGDSAITVPVGNVDEEALNLIDITEKSLVAAIDVVREGNRIGDIGSTVQQFAIDAGFGIVRDFVGHGIGRRMHEEPSVPNFGQKGNGPRIKIGMVLAVEPMFNLGGDEVKVLEDGWTVVTKDGALSAHFEHTIACTENGPWLLSARG